ncbi:ComF family protein [Aliiglaciecola sp. LCG003]|uniref:ComF family protein n=1 Tax=Aliiglaciecola sp. LCG003 TaxID=3053655 RepID=UPI002573D24D|nr:ComF family protein [Aliiglaciecola sp. LCG003]WJG09329.1 ComF family protein [Aliiglaciecola sp. LCG003]
MEVNSNKGWLSLLALNRNCLLCRQLSPVLICPVCCHDMPHYDLARYDFNMLNRIKVRVELKTFSAGSLLALAEYQWPLSQLIQGLKFSKKALYAKALAQVFCHFADSLPSLPQALVPIPLHPKRLATRKYNQAACIAQQIAKLKGIKCYANTLKRLKYTQPQTDLSAAQRYTNTRNAFACHRPLIGVDHIAVFDDVITTGSTVSAAVNVLKERYPSLRIDVWAICITPEHR